MSHLLGILFEFATFLVTKFSYLGIIIGMTIESASIPLPSEAIMGFAGYLVSTGVFKFWPAILAGSTGNVIGSTIMYVLGKYGGHPFLEKYGKWFRISHKELHKAENWFGKYGDIAVFIAQLLPVIRTFISLPAGILEISYKKFALYTFMGAFVWCTVLVYLGKVLGSNWEHISSFIKPVQNIMIVVVLILFAYFVYTHFFKKSRNTVE